MDGLQLLNRLGQMDISAREAAAGIQSQNQAKSSRFRIKAIITIEGTSLGYRLRHFHSSDGTIWRIYEFDFVEFGYKEKQHVLC